MGRRVSLYFKSREELDLLEDIEEFAREQKISLNKAVFQAIRLKRDLLETKDRSLARAEELIDLLKRENKILKEANQFLTDEPEIRQKRLALIEVMRRLPSSSIEAIYNKIWPKIKLFLEGMPHLMAYLQEKGLFGEKEKVS